MKAMTEPTGRSGVGFLSVIGRIEMPVSAVAETGLVYVSDSEPGITRRRAGRGFSYLMPDGSRIERKTERARIDALGIPPAYDGVWICTRRNGHIQATGKDERERKQYRYHPDWSEWRARQKFDQQREFADALPRIRRRVRADLGGDPGELDYTLAALAFLLEYAPMRVGNREYALENGTFGATTLLNRHVELDGDTVRMDYRAKGGKRVRRTMHHKRLHRVLESIADLPGKELFVWRNRDGDFVPVDSSRLNTYLAEISGLETVTAKTFRTWAGTLTAFREAISTIEAGETPTVKALSEAAAEELQNTPVISRTSYIHPAVIDLAKDEDDTRRHLTRALEKPATRKGLLADEQRLTAFLDLTG